MMVSAFPGRYFALEQFCRFGSIARAERLLQQVTLWMGDPFARKKLQKRS